jgi:hypothetical protein
VKTIKITPDYVDFQQKLYNSVASWKDEAACKSALFDNNEDFFDTSEPALKLLAKKYCYGCPVQGHCLYTSLVTNEVYGLWGALTPKQRKVYLKYIFITAQEQGIDTKYWNDELNVFFQKYSNPQKLKEVFPRIS